MRSASSINFSRFNTIVLPASTPSARADTDFNVSSVSVPMHGRSKRRSWFGLETLTTTAPPLRIAFFGTPAFAVPTLDALLASRHQVVGVVTQPDRPRGRGQKLEPTPVARRGSSINSCCPMPTSWASSRGKQVRNAPLSTVARISTSGAGRPSGRWATRLSVRFGPTAERYSVRRLGVA